MEFNSKTIREVIFGAKVRGYDPAEVDEFIAAVADGVDELQERLRRANDRASAAESQLAALKAEPVKPSSAEISKVWERAATAAELAVSEAKATAQELLDSAKKQSETEIVMAKVEAARIAEDSQAQLRRDILQLETARDQLKTDVDTLGTHLEVEREKVRAVLTRALSALDDKQKEAAQAPPVSDIVVPEQPAVEEIAPPVSASVAPIAETPVAENRFEPKEEESVDPWRSTSSEDVASTSFSSTPTPATEDEEDVSASEAQSFGWSVPDWRSQSQEAEPEQYVSPPNASSAEQPLQEWKPEEQSSVAKDDEDEDPFLAELRRAVQNDSPLGPRDAVSDESAAVDETYDEDDERSGFFRRKK